MMDNISERFDVAIPDGVISVGGPAQRLASDGMPYRVYGFIKPDVLPADIEAGKAELIAYYQRWLNGFCLGHGVRKIEWRSYPEIAVYVKRRTKNKRADIKVYSRFHSAEADANEAATIAALFPEIAGINPEFR